MKKRNLSFLIVLFMTVIFCQNTNAQSNKEETDLMQSVFGMQKKAVMAGFISVSSTDPFWALYDEYETKRKELGVQRLDALANYANNYDSLDPEKYDATINDMIKLRNKTDKLMDQYYKKIKKASGSKVAAQFYQLEGYVLTQIRSSILEEIPYIGEFDN